MAKLASFFLVALAVAGYFTSARAEFIITSAIIEFTQDGARQQDIELVSHSKTNDYVVSEVSEVINPGAPEEQRKLIEDPSAGRLLVTPDKTILAGGGHKLLRFVLLREPDDQEHIYRVQIKPVIKGVESNSKMGLKILVGYEVLAIIRPVALQPRYTAIRNGKILTVSNTGNTNILFQNGQQCPDSLHCKIAPVLRIYPGQSDHVTLPFDAVVNYSIWDGKDNIDKKF